MLLKRRRFLFIILIILLSLIKIHFIYAEENETYQISQNIDDGYIFGYGDSWDDAHNVLLATTLDDVTSFLVFRNIDNLTAYDYVDNATLSVYVNTPQIPENITVTIYGIMDDDISIPIFVRHFEKSRNYVNWNITDLTSSGWYNVSVTQIVNEILNRYGYNGNIGFRIDAIETDFADRWCVAHDASPNLSAKLYLQYDVEPNKTGWDFYEWYKGYIIWSSPDYWVNFTEYTQIAGDGQQTVHNSTHLQCVNLDDANNDRLYKIETLSRHVVRFQLKNMGNIIDVSSAEEGLVNVLVGIDDDTDYQWEVADGKIGFVLEHETSYQFRFRFFGKYSGGGGWSAGNDTWRGVNTFKSRYGGKFFEVGFDKNTGNYWYKVAHDINFNNVFESYTDVSVNRMNNITWTHQTISDKPMNTPETYQDYLNWWMVSYHNMTSHYHVTYPNGTSVTPENFTTPNDARDYIDEIIEETDPYNPDTDSPVNPYITRFSIRFYWLWIGIISIGISCVYFAYKPSVISGAYAIMFIILGIIIMFTGVQS